MEGGQSRTNLKRPFVEDPESNKPPSEKRVRFPKGKKVRSGDYVFEDSPSKDVPNWSDPRLAAKERTIRRNEIAEELLDDENRDFLPDIKKAEVHYMDNETFVEEGVQIDPFNLDKEREEGYFDANGNYVEYVNENQIKDAWLDSVDVYEKYTEKSSIPTTNDEESRDLTSEELAKIKRRIANVLEPGETVLQALRRLKGTSGNKKQKMSAETKLLFDQLTDDAMKLMESGDYDVYDEKQESFQREAEGYEKLAQARMQGTSMSSRQEVSYDIFNEDAVPNGADMIRPSFMPSNVDTGASKFSISTTTDDGDDAFDMFAEDDVNTSVNPALDGSESVSVQPSEGGDLQNDYIYDESSGYYYSSSLGYYYDPSSGLYCSAASGQWYSYNEESGSYDEVQQTASSLS
ncbi:CD2 antigen cytoplasmic tail-binding 2 [Olea europaea subsp. europaea]|uniref:CD2 antigen cytoplasmic tail-binding 2 n=4 Tax=Olea europaea subsp. europaea TaxID=158383 RepID=A0A8S0VI26_OLEEU|nr:CD2 antigen cytoplasmic tail-binding 2 [Olea europaea subsp. europaea]